MANPIVSVICTCFNHKKYIRGSLLSVINQTYKNIQLIVVDNASSDGSVAEINLFMKEFPNTLFIQNSENFGITKAFNAAVKMATGQYLIDLSGDDELTPDRISLQVQTFERLDASFGMIYSNVEEIDQDNNHLRYSLEKNSNYPSGNLFSAILKNHFIPSPSTIFRTESFLHLGGYNENHPFEDFDYWVRCAQKYSIHYLPIISTRKRILKNSLSSYFYRPIESYKMLESTCQTYEWAKTHTSKHEMDDFNSGAFYYYKQSILLHHLEIATKFSTLIDWTHKLPKSSFFYSFILKQKINISFFYRLYRLLFH